MKNNYDYMEIGSCPIDEECAQVGSKEYDYTARATKELKAYAEQLYREFPEALDKILFKVKWFPHDFGTYGEVVIYWNMNSEEDTDLAYEIEKNLPTKWDEIAINELNLNNTTTKKEA